MNYKQKKKSKYKHKKTNRKLSILVKLLILFSIFVCIKLAYNIATNVIDGTNFSIFFKNTPKYNKSYPVSIKEVTYKWDGSLNYKFHPIQIVLHHTASKTATVESIHNGHLANGWAGIGYHFVIRKDGTIYRGRPENAVGSHVKDKNSKSFGICLEGDFDKEHITSAQKKSVVALCAMLMDKYYINKIIKHSDAFSTDCPGKNFPFDEICTDSFTKLKEFSKLPN